MSVPGKCTDYSKPILTNEDMKKIRDFYETIDKLTLFRGNDDHIRGAVQTVKQYCSSGRDVELLAYAIYNYCLRNKVTSEAGAHFCQQFGGFSVEDKKLRTIILRKLQEDYIGAAGIYKEREKFIQNVRILYDFFCHLRLPGGECFKCFTQALVEYFDMLLRDENDAQIAAFTELLPKCYKELKEHQPDKLAELLKTLQNKILTFESELNRIILLETLEQVLAPDAYENKIPFYKVLKEKNEKV